jgi:hypothetical protein
MFGNAPRRCGAFSFLARPVARGGMAADESGRICWGGGAGLTGQILMQILLKGLLVLAVSHCAKRRPLRGCRRRAFLAPKRLVVAVRARGPLRVDRSARHIQGDGRCRANRISSCAAGRGHAQGGVCRNTLGERDADGWARAQNV